MSRFRKKCTTKQDAIKELAKWKSKGFKGYIGFTRTEGHYIIIETEKSNPKKKKMTPKQKRVCYVTERFKRKPKKKK